MKVFQIIHKYGPYLPYFESKYRIPEISRTYKEHKEVLISDRFYSPHVLLPVLNSDSETFFTMWNYDSLQLKWAKERGWREKNLKKILFAQIEEFKPDVFYCCSPIYFTRDEILKLGPGNMKKIAWFASPEKNKIDFSVYDTRLTNLPADIQSKKITGFRSDLFHPAVDDVMNEMAKSKERPVDIFFYGQYFPHNFKKRNEYIDLLIKLKKRTNWNIRISLQYDLYYKSVLPDIVPERLRDSRYAKVFRLNEIVFPDEEVRSISEPSLYGLDLYSAISKSKIIFNAAVDFSGQYKVNMRIFESLGCGAHMISDDGIYPDGLIKNVDFSVYSSFDEFVTLSSFYLNNPDESRKIAESGRESVFLQYSKEKQWQKFKEIVEEL